MQPRLMPTQIAVALPCSSSLHTGGLTVSDDRCIAPVETNTSISMSCKRQYVAMRSRAAIWSVVCKTTVEYN
eukprot:5774264-Prymnesium_polylepis.1